ncbi:MAG: cyclin family protein [Promethearchaeota archaeon]
MNFKNNKDFSCFNPNFNSPKNIREKCIDGIQKFGQRIEQSRKLDGCINSSIKKSLNRNINVFKHLKLKKEELQNYLDYYIEKYANIYSNRFKTIDLNRNRVENPQVYNEFVHRIIKNGQIPYIVYEICDNETGWIRVGWSSHSPDERMNWYLLRSFSPNLSANMANIYYEMAKIGSKRKCLARFDMKVRYVFSTKGEAQIMEEFLTIFRNRADNPDGYDLTLNNEYNKIVGDIYKRGLRGSFPKASLNPKWCDVPPIPLADAILNGSEMNELESLFEVSSRTIRRRFRAYGYGVRGTYDLIDARAFLLKPYIIKGIKRAMSQEEFFKFCEKEGINLFKNFKFIKNKENSRGSFFRRMLKQIWNTSKHKEVRYQVISDYIISAITKPDITPGEAEFEVRRIVDFKYEREFARICNHVFGRDFVKQRDEIYKPIIRKLALKYHNHRDINLRIAIDLGMCKRYDLLKSRKNAARWIGQYIKRNFGVSGKNLPNTINPKIPKFKSIKEHINEYMEENPIARPKEVYEKFPNFNLETIRHAIKEWKKDNKDKIERFSSILIEQYIDEMDLDKNLETKAKKILESFITSKKPPLNSEWKAIIGGVIYFTSKLLDYDISYNQIAEYLNVDSHTISKRYREIVTELNLRT